MPEPNPVLAFLAELTPWLAIGIAVLAIMSIAKKGLAKPAISPKAPITTPDRKSVV